MEDCDDFESKQLISSFVRLTIGQKSVTKSFQFFKSKIDTLISLTGCNRNCKRF